MLGSCRYFVKKELVWKIPIFGWSFWVGSCSFRPH